MNIVILSSAEEEFADAVDFYNVQCPVLGYEFAAEVKRAFANHSFSGSMATVFKAYPSLFSQSISIWRSLPGRQGCCAGRRYHASQLRPQELAFENRQVLKSQSLLIDTHESTLQS